MKTLKEINKIFIALKYAIGESRLFKSMPKNQPIVKKFLIEYKLMKSSLN